MKKALVPHVSVSIFVGALVIALLTQMQWVHAASLISLPVPFDTLNYDPEDNFNPGDGDLFGTTTDGGLGDSGAANVAGRTNLYTHKDSFDIPDVGETAAVSAFFKYTNEGGEAYLGFVASSSVNRESENEFSESAIGVRFDDIFNTIIVEGDTQNNDEHPELVDGEWYKAVFALVTTGADTYTANFQLWTASSTDASTVTLMYWKTIEDVIYEELALNTENPGEIHAFFGNANAEFSLVDNFEVRDEALEFPWEGDGEAAETAYEITSCEELQAVGSQVGEIDAYYRLENDINCAESVWWNGGEGFLPIGTKWSAFDGEFDGNGKVISNLHIDREDSYQGLFQELSGTILDLGLEEVSISGGYVTGALVGFSGSGGLIEDSYVSGGSVSSNHNQYAGGLVGYNEVGEIYRSYADVAVEGDSYVGGFAGYNNGHIEESYALGSVEGGYRVGGFVGGNDEIIMNAYARGAVSGVSDSIGGFAGNNYGQIFYAYSTGEVSQAEDTAWAMGGFVGDNGADTIYSSFSVGSVSVEPDYEAVGGFIGADYLSQYNSGWFTGAFSVGIGGVWDGDSEEWVPSEDVVTWSQDDADDFKNPNLGLFTTDSDDMPDGYEGEAFEVWDFSEEGVWGINETNPEENNDGWPFFRWQGLTHSFVGDDEEETPAPRRRSSSSGNRVVARQTSSVPVSTATPSSSSFARDLETGSSGADVLELQKFLNTKGFTIAPSGPGSPGNETNLFGAFTRAALVRFQAAHGIAPASGYFGPVTRAFIANMGGTVPTNVPAVPEDIPEVVRDLDMDMTGNDVRALQTLLMAEGHSIPAGATGYFGSQTRDALIAYQVKNAITPAVGYFGEKTRSQMKVAGLSGLWW